MERWLFKFVLRCRSLFRSQRVEEELDEELRFHLEQQIRDHLDRKLTRDEATRAARLALGGVEQQKEACRDARRVTWIENAIRDVRYGSRGLRANPGFAAAVIGTLALGIGANTAIFSICNAVLFKPLPYAEANRLVMLWERTPAGTLMTVAPANFVDWRSGNRSFREVAALNPNPSFILGGQSEPARLAGAAVSANFFPLLGVRCTLGRSFLPEEDQPGKDHVAILSHRVWQERFATDGSIAGRHITLNDSSYTVVGVLPSDFQFAKKAADFQARSQFDVWVPMALDTQKLQRGTHPLRVVARLKPGVDLTQAQAELDVMAMSLARQYPEDNRSRGSWRCR